MTTIDPDDLSMLQRLADPVRCFYLAPLERRAVQAALNALQTRQDYAGSDGTPVDSLESSQLDTAHPGARGGQS